MIILQVLEMLIALLLMPALMGLITYRKGDSKVITWVSGFLYEWAAMFIVAVPLIVLEKELTTVMWIWTGVCVALSLVGVFSFIRRYGAEKEKRAYERSMKLEEIDTSEELSSIEDTTKASFKSENFRKRKLLSKTEILYLGLFLAIVLFQLYKTIFYAYADGDDAYYISVAQAAATSNTMYKLDAYMGITTTVNFRYALAPFPIWIAALSRLSGINVAILSHCVLASVLILVTYGIYNEISKLLFKEDREKRYMFMALLSVFFMFENVSTSTQGTFLLTRSRQGKEALANIILPFLFYLILRIIRSDLQIVKSDVVLLIVTGIAAALCSMLGNILAPLMVFSLFVYAIIKRTRFKKLFLIAITVAPNILAMLLYVIM